MKNKKIWMMVVFVLILFILVMGVLYILPWVTSPGVTGSRCSKLGGKIVNNLEGKGCPDGRENMGMIKADLNGDLPDCPCICCVRKE